jgi:flavin reductase (DIM6/NTAB) family NADH-FMN oxidoreductase RutF
MTSAREGARGAPSAPTGGTPIETATFRAVLSNFPTGVCAITTMRDGQPAGMAVGSFTSVSLQPPLVAFLADSSSSTLASVLHAGRFCVNVLGNQQEAVCRALARKGEDKFRDLGWNLSSTGSVRIRGAIAWIECVVQDVFDAGDHRIVVGAVEALDHGDSGLPLLFFRGGYGKFAPGARVMQSEPDLLEQIRRAESARPAMEQVAGSLQLECVAVAFDRDDIVQVASAGRPRNGASPSRVGVRMPFRPPMGAVFIAYSDESTVDRWLGLESSDAAARDAHVVALRRLRERGWSISLRRPALQQVDQLLDELAIRGPDAGLIDELASLHEQLGGSAVYDLDQIEADKVYAVRSMSVPIIDHGGRVMLYLALFGWPERTTGEQLLTALDMLRAAADELRSPP